MAKDADCVLQCVSSSTVSSFLLSINWGSQTRVFWWAFSLTDSQVSSYWAQLSGLLRLKACCRLSTLKLGFCHLRSNELSSFNWAPLKWAQVSYMLQAVVALSNWAPTELLSNWELPLPNTTPELTTTNQSPAAAVGIKLIPADSSGNLPGLRLGLVYIFQLL